MGGFGYGNDSGDLPVRGQDSGGERGVKMIERGTEIERALE